MKAVLVLAVFFVIAYVAPQGATEEHQHESHEGHHGDHIDEHGRHRPHHGSVCTKLVGLGETPLGVETISGEYAPLYRRTSGMDPTDATRRAITFPGRLLLAVLLVFGLFATQEASAMVGFTMTQGTQDGTYIRFNRVPTNMIADVTKELGAFRCSQPGLYYFSFTAMAPSQGSCRISLRKNRVPIVTAFASNSGFSWISSGAVLYLSQGDVVYPYVEDGAIHESSAPNRAFTSFSGFTVSTDSLMARNGPVVDATEGPLTSPDPYDDIEERMYRVELAKNATKSA
ncbi:hypothetical protein HPB51_028770 [Rhipicephalus microplus]|uniref:C1q domain-containing protein n=1 Tax=Rhipicephalus microplus TaxID=6941 RepID=A0A9J6CWP9_RHIMP|nr:hypothetical protein HPB51_028770 [Rhipicephalus microplus]